MSMDTAIRSTTIPQRTRARDRSLERDRGPLTTASPPLASNGSLVEARPADVSRRRSYQLRYYASAVRSVCRPHRFTVPADRRTYRTEVKVNPTLYQQWLRLFDVSSTAGARFTYFTTSGTSLFMRMLTDLGINLRHVLHLASETRFLRRAEPHPVLGIHQLMSAEITGVSVVGDDRVCLTVEHELMSTSGRVLQQSRETFVIGGISRTTMDEVREIATPATFDLRRILTRTPRLGGGPGVRRAQLAIRRDAGLRYGAISGDLNMVHTTRTAAKIFGYRGAFLQGLGTANHVLADIARFGPGDLQAFDVTFTRPLYLDQTVELARDRHDFEVTDERRHVVAYGTYAAAS